MQKHLALASVTVGSLLASAMYSKSLFRQISAQMRGSLVVMSSALMGPQVWAFLGRPVVTLYPANETTAA